MHLNLITNESHSSSDKKFVTTPLSDSKGRLSFSFYHSCTLILRTVSFHKAGMKSNKMDGKHLVLQSAL